MEENLKKVERSDLWNQIYKEVSQIPKQVVDYDAVDYISATTSIEKIIKKLNTCTATERALLNELLTKGVFKEEESITIYTPEETKVPIPPCIMIGEDEQVASRLYQDDFETSLETFYKEDKKT